MKDFILEAIDRAGDGGYVTINSADNSITVFDTNGNSIKFTKGA